MIHTTTAHFITFHLNQQKKIISSLAPNRALCKALLVKANGECRELNEPVSHTEVLLEKSLFLLRVGGLVQ